MMPWHRFQRCQCAGCHCQPLGPRDQDPGTHVSPVTFAGIYCPFAHTYPEPLQSQWPGCHFNGSAVTGGLGMFSGIRAGIGGGFVSATEAVAIPAPNRSNKPPAVVLRRVITISCALTPIIGDQLYALRELNHRARAVKNPNATTYVPFRAVTHSRRLCLYNSIQPRKK